MGAEGIRGTRLRAGVLMRFRPEEEEEEGEGEGKREEQEGDEDDDGDCDQADDAKWQAERTEFDRKVREQKQYCNRAIDAWDRIHCLWSELSDEQRQAPAMSSIISATDVLDDKDREVLGSTAICTCNLGWQVCAHDTALGAFEGHDLLLKPRRAQGEFSATSSARGRELYDRKLAAPRHAILEQSEVCRSASESMPGG